MKKILSFALIVFCSVILFSCGNNKKAEDKAPADSVKKAPVAVIPVDSMATVIDFYATWCGPCKEFSPIFEKMEKKYDGKINFKRVDVDQDPALAAQYDIQSIPTVVIIPVRGETKKFVGLMSEKDFEAELVNYLPASK